MSLLRSRIHLDYKRDRANGTLKSLLNLRLKFFHVREEDCWGSNGLSRPLAAVEEGRRSGHSGEWTPLPVLVPL